MTPQEIVAELDHHIVGQQRAKRAVAIALRNRWRRMQVDETLRDEVTPKNILMIGPTGVGKTEIARRLARARQRAVHQGRGDQVHRGRLRRQGRRLDRPRPGRHGGQAGARGGRCSASAQAPKTPPRSASSTSLCRARAASSAWRRSRRPDNTARQVLRKRLREGPLDEREIEIEVAEQAGARDHGAARHGGDDRAAAAACSPTSAAAEARRAS